MVIFLALCMNIDMPYKPNEMESSQNKKTADFCKKTSAGKNTCQML